MTVVGAALRGRPAAQFLLVAAGLAHAPSPHTEGERDCLARYARGKRSVVELGVDRGAATAILRAAMSPTGSLYAVDPHPAGRLGVSFPRLIAHVEVARLPNGRVQWLRMTEAEAAAVLTDAEPDGAELVFSDCVFDYDALAGEWHRWRERVAPGGIFIQSTSQPFADRTDDDHDAVRFTRDVLLLDPDFECIEVIDTFTVLARHIDSQRSATVSATR
jgi:hypothetical protein